MIQKTEFDADTQESVSANGKHSTPKTWRRRGYLFSKRVFDISAALIAGILLLVPMLVIALIIRIESPGPAIFKQKRMGQYGKVFTIYKFRTMRMEAPSDKATRDMCDSKKYITKLGAFLRRTSIDELPQIMNILNGTMSFVGYRPVCLTECDLNRMREEKGVFEMRPGITGYAQVNGRDNVTSEKKSDLDAEYVVRSGVKMDMWCLVATVKVIFTGEGVM